DKARCTSGSYPRHRSLPTHDKASCTSGSYPRHRSLPTHDKDSCTSGSYPRQANDPRLSNQINNIFISRCTFVGAAGLINTARTTTRFAAAVKQLTTSRLPIKYKHPTDSGVRHE